LRRVQAKFSALRAGSRTGDYLASLRSCYSSEIDVTLNSTCFDFGCVCVSSSPCNSVKRRRRSYR